MVGVREHIHGLHGRNGIAGRLFVFRMAEKCCANCRYGVEGYEGECDCSHPLVDADERWRMGGTIVNVCDLWERKGGAE